MCTCFKYVVNKKFRSQLKQLKLKEEQIAVLVGSCADSKGYIDQRKTNVSTKM